LKIKVTATKATSKLNFNIEEKKPMAHEPREKILFFVTTTVER